MLTARAAEAKTDSAPRSRPSRGYQMNKIQENNEAEIMEVILNDARESYAPEIVVELQSETPEQMEQNLERILSWVEAWRSNRAEDDDDEEEEP